MTARGSVETMPQVHTREERAAIGRAARSVVPRSSHAEFPRDPDRPSPLDLLAAQDAARLPELLPIRYGRMAATPFTYFRGAALPPERRLVFDIDDFDETLSGPWEWDLERLAASLEIASRDNEFSPAQCRRVVVTAAAEYRRAMRELAARTSLAVWHANADVESLNAMYGDRLRPKRRHDLTRNAATARTRDHLTALRDFTEVRGGEGRIEPDATLGE